MDRPTHQAPRPFPSRGLSLARPALALLLCVLLVGCSTGLPTNATAALPSPTATAAAASWPRTIVDDEGTSLEFAGPPQRLISLSPANTEIVFALGAGDRLLGGTDYDDFPAAAVDLPDVATFTGVIIEKVVDLAPDLVLAAGNNFTSPADITRLRELGIPVLVVYAPTVDDVLGDIRLIGRAIGADPAAGDITAGMAARIDQVTAAVDGLPQPRVFYEIGAEPEIYGPAPDSFVADMVDLAGGEPITTTDPAVFSISLERLVTLDPEVIVLGDAAYGVCPAGVAARPAWGGMTAVREGALRPVDDTIVTRPGPRLAEGLAALALAIHPTADLRPPADAPELCTAAP